MNVLRHRLMRGLLWFAFGQSGVLSAREAAGQSEPTHETKAQESARISETTTRLRESRRMTGIHFDSNTGVLVGIEGHVGLSMLAMDSRREGHAVLGGLLRGTYRFIEFGGTIEQSDYTEEQTRFLGGFAGAYLPYTNWVDVHATAGLGVRRYQSHDTRYGAAGANVTVPSLVLRLGVSDRSSERIFAARLGAALFAQIDVAEKNAHWEYQLQGRTVLEGNTTFGGISVGMVMSLGFDLSFRRGEDE